MAVSDEEVTLVRQATDIVGLIGEHVALRKSGRQWMGLCPFHQEKTPSFYVNAEDGLYYCHGCQASGDAISFVRDTEHLDFLDALQLLADRAHITLRSNGGAHSTAKRQRRELLQDTLSKAVAYYQDLLRTSDEAAPVREYLASRGYDEGIVSRFQLGYSPIDFDALSRALGLPHDLLVGAGLGFLNRRGRFQDAFRGRLIFPILDPSGRPVACGGRLVPGHTPLQDGAAPKYRNSPETPIYSKRRTLYGLNWAKSDVVASGEIVVCEGYTDVIGCFQAGVERAVATCGTSLAEEHFAILRKFARKIVMAYDADSAGASGADRVYGWERVHEVSVAVASLPSGSDPGDLAASDPALLRNAISTAQPYLGFRLGRLLGAADLTTAEGRAKIFEEGVVAIAEHPNDLVRDQYLVMMAERTLVPVDQARQRLDQVVRRKNANRGAPLGGGATASPATGSIGVAGRVPVTDGTGTSPIETPVGRGTTATAGASDALRPPPGPTDRIEAEALRLVIAGPRVMVDHLDECLFLNPVYRNCYRALVSAGWDVHAAREAAGEPIASSLSRLAVEEPAASDQDVWRRLIEMASARALEETKREIRLDPSLFSALEPVRSAIRIAMEELRDTRDAERSAAAANTLLSWLIERDSDHSDSATASVTTTDSLNSTATASA